MKTTLLIMAAGIGSRFGTGIKQLEPVDASNHIIMDYSIHDAIEAGFNHVVFIIRKDIEKEFKEVIGDRIASICSAHNVTVDYAFQDINDIPGELPESRTKPWGTGQAVLAAKDVIKTPFIVINADDYYGKEGFKAVFVGTGAGLPKFMGIPGENLNGVFSANEFLTRNNLMKAFREDHLTPIHAGKKCCVVGGGNVAMDAARTALRLGADTTIVYRRTENELPARKEEVHHAKEEGIEFKTLCNPVEILGGEDGRVNGIMCVRMELGEPDASGRRRPIAIEGSEFVLDVDTVIMALGTSPNPLIRSTTPGLDTNRKGGLIVDENEMTTRTGVFAGGDAVTGAATVILAMGAGKKGAAAIDAYLKK